MPWYHNGDAYGCIALILESNIPKKSVPEGGTPSGQDNITGTPGHTAAPVAGISK